MCQIIVEQAVLKYYEAEGKSEMCSQSSSIGMLRSTREVMTGKRICKLETV